MFDRPAAAGIVEAFSRLVARRSSDAMVVSRARHTTFGDVDALSQVVAASIASASLPPGSLIGLSAAYGPAFLVGFLGLRRAGQTVVPLDPLAPQEERRRAVAALGATAVLSCAKAWPSSVDDFRLSMAESVREDRSLPAVAVVKLTSGSTGVPRGVAMTEESLLVDEAALAAAMGFRDDDRLLSALPLSHSYGFTTLALSSLVRGLTLVLPSDQGPFAPTPLRANSAQPSSRPCPRTFRPC